MRKKILIILLLPFISFAQELDQAYLDSLPEDVRKELLEKVDEDKSKEKPIYRKPSTFIEKDDDEKDDESSSNKLFGSDFFNSIQSSFMPINEPNLDSNYILDFGDVLQIQLIGQKDSIDEYYIERDGSINVPDIGKLILSGLSLNDASEYIKAKVKNAYIGMDSYISLKFIRDINVLVVGNAYNPGVYTLNGNSNILHALSMAGGINEYGSYRNIQLKRNGKVIETLDIYDLLINGNNNLSSGLRSGDSIVVMPIQKVISVESGLSRKAKYELMEDEGFLDVLNFANGFSKNADNKNIQIKRIQNGVSAVIKVNYEDLNSFELIDNDSIFVREFKFKTVTIEGAVLNPGTYILDQNATLSDLIKTSGGYESFAYPFGGYLENKNALEINKDAKTKLYNKFVNNLVLNSRAQNTSGDGIDMILKQILETPVTGRVIAEFDLDVIANNEELDTILEDGDAILIPSITQQVYIQGEVSNPGAIRYSPKQDLDYYIRNAGGTLNSADTKNIFIIHPNGETANLSKNRNLSFLAENDIQNFIYPGSIIYVPQTTNLANSLEVASIWAPIISSIALSLTSLSVLNNTN